MISVIITTYKRESFILYRSIESVIKQTFLDWEMIIVDDSPETFPDRKNVEKMMIKLMKDDTRIRYIKHETNKGACAARNTGLECAKGEYVAFLDDDDEWLPNKLDVQLAKIKEIDTVGLVYCSYIAQNDEKKTSEIVLLEKHEGKIYEELLYYNFVGSTSFPLIKTDALRMIGGFDTLMESAQDYDTWLRLSKITEVAYVEEPLIIYHIHTQERISTNNYKVISGQERIIEKNKDYLTLNKKAMWYRKTPLIVPYARSKKLKKAIVIWLDTCLMQPGMFKDNIKNFLRIIKYFGR